MADRKRIELEGEKLKVYNELKKEAKKANVNLTNIYREYGENTWAAKKLRERLTKGEVQGLTASGKIRVSKNMSLMQMRAILKHTKQFRASKTSTLRGIKSVKKEVVIGLQTALNDETLEVSNMDANDLYQMLEDKDNFLPFVNKVSASTMWTLVDDAKESGINRYTMRIDNQTLIKDAKKYGLISKNLSNDEAEELISVGKREYIDRLNSIHKSEWIGMLENYMTDGMSAEYRKKAEQIFNKYLKVK